MMIIVTDAHVCKSRGNQSAFFDMLEAIAATPHDLIFLGDIFELWIALPGYEEDIHLKFIEWCLKQKNKRTIGFLEGNHEFYLANRHAPAFTWCSNQTSWQDDAGALFLHGDQVNRKDKIYLAFKKLIKNRPVKLILQFLPCGPGIVRSIKNRLKESNNKYRLKIPWDEIAYFADSRFAEGLDTIFVGHFHRQHCLRNQESKKLYLLPDWLSTQKVTLYRRSLGEVSMIHWRELQ